MLTPLWSNLDPFPEVKNDRGLSFAVNVFLCLWALGNVGIWLNSYTEGIFKVLSSSFLFIVSIYRNMIY
jgi:hypothetical protein